MAHWYVVAASPERLAEIRAVDPLVDPFAGPLDRGAQSSLYHRIATAAPDGLWIRWAALEPPNMDALRRLRVAQPGLAIILEIPNDWTPPNPDLAQAVGLGIYAIVPESAPFATASMRPYTYADAAAWHGVVRSFDDPDPVRMVEKVVEREKIVEKHVAISTRPTVIAVAGMLSGVGTSSIAVALARYLASRGWAVAISEHGSHPTLAARAADLPGVVAYPDPAPLPTAIAAERKFAYVIGDFGSDADWPTLQTHARPDLALWVIPGDPHRHSMDLPLRLGPRDPLLGIVGPGPDQAQAAAGWSHRTGIPAVVWSDQPDHLRTVLATVLPDSSPGRRWFPRVRKAHIIRHPPAGPSAEPDPGDPRSLGQAGRPMPTTKIVVETRSRRQPLACGVVRWGWRLSTAAVLASLGLWLLTIVGTTGLVSGDPSWLTTAAHLHRTEWAWILHRWPGMVRWIGPAIMAPATHGLPF